MVGTNHPPVRMRSLKKFYEEYGTDWIPTEKINKTMETVNHKYGLRDGGELESILGGEGLINRDGSDVPHKVSFNITKFYRITAKGLHALNKYYKIKDRNYKLVTKSILTGKNSFLNK